MRSLTALVFIAPLFAACIATEHQESHPEQSAQAFDVLKSLAGQWSGTMSDGTNSMPKASVEYQVVSAGSAVLERLGAGTEHEMITMYHRDGDRLLMTHYCAMGNQPRMQLVGFARAAEKTLTFAYLDATNLASPKQMVMHDMRLSVIDKNHINANWIAFENGVQSHIGNFDFHRIQTLGY